VADLRIKYAAGRITEILQSQDGNDEKIICISDSDGFGIYAYVGPF
jgi:hypothetical protein